MTTDLVNRHAIASRSRRRGRLRRPASAVTLRPASAHEAPALHALIAAHTAEGHLLPRTLDDLTVHASRFVVAVRGGRIVGGAELAPLSGRVAEVRSLVVDTRARSLGIGRQLVTALRAQARQAGYETLCAFAHESAFFVRLGFSIVPHTQVPEKIARDCLSCAQFRRCGQHALVLSLSAPARQNAETHPPFAGSGG